MMGLKKSKNTEAASKSPPEKGDPSVKTKSKETPLASQKRMKKNTSRKSSRGLELNFNRVKIFNQPEKIKLMTDFLHSIKNA